MLNLPLKAKRDCLVIPRRKGLIIPFIVLLFGFSSCRPAKEIAYYRDLPRDTSFLTQLNKSSVQLVQPGDILSINVTSLSPDNSMFNAPPLKSADQTGYLVDSSGNIDFYKLGEIKVAGKTVKNVQNEIQEGLKPYLREALVGVGLENRHITLFGGVSPQLLPYPSTGINILEAIAASGDIGEKGKGEDILLIRTTGDSTVFKRLDVTTKMIFKSPYFYLEPNDIVYVEPAKPKQKTTAPQVISYITAGISFIFLIVNNILRL